MTNKTWPHKFGDNDYKFEILLCSHIVDLKANFQVNCYILVSVYVENCNINKNYASKKDF